MFRSNNQPFTHTRIPTEDECTPEYRRKLRDSQVARKNGYGYKQTCYYPLPNSKHEYKRALAECRDVQDAIERNDRNNRVSHVVTTAGMHDKQRDRQRHHYDSRMEHIKRRQDELDEESEAEDVVFNRRLKQLGVPDVRSDRDGPVAMSSFDPRNIITVEEDSDQEVVPLPQRRRRPPPPPPANADRQGVPTNSRGLGDRTVQDQAAIQDAIELLSRFNIPVSMPNGGMQIRRRCSQNRVDPVRSTEGATTGFPHTTTASSVRPRKLLGKRMHVSARQFRDGVESRQAATLEVWQQWN